MGKEQLSSLSNGVLIFISSSRSPYSALSFVISNVHTLAEQSVVVVEQRE